MPIQTKDTTATAQADDTYTISFGAKVDTTIPSGTYSDTITIAVVASPLVFGVQFNGNGADAGNMDLFGMGCPGQATPLPANTFTRDGYVFTGWNTAPDGSGVSYSDRGTYVVPHEPSEYLITLCAQWEKAYYIQDFTNPQCQSLASDVNLTVIDKQNNGKTCKGEFTANSQESCTEHHNAGANAKHQRVAHVQRCKHAFYFIG